MRNFNKTGVRLWTDRSIDQDGELNRNRTQTTLSSTTRCPLDPVPKPWQVPKPSRLERSQVKIATVNSQ
jgi:hypothetical protein